MSKTPDTIDDSCLSCEHLGPADGITQSCVGCRPSIDPQTGVRKLSNYKPMQGATDWTLVDPTTSTYTRWSTPPIRMTFSREELVDMARSYVAASYPIAEQDVCNARFGLLVHFISGLFEQEKGGAQ